jgi:peroxiredoxin
MAEAVNQDTLEQLIEAAGQRWLDAWQRGPTRLTWAALPPQLGDPAPDVELPDSEAANRRLSAFWQRGPALILFWRHFGCSCGMDRAERLRQELPEYRAAGAEVVIVAQGEPARAARYRTSQELDVPILCDPQLRTYEAFGLLQGTPAQVLFDAPDEFLRRDLQAGIDLAASRRGTPRALVDDPWQLAGEFVVRTDGTLSLIHRYGWCEDYPDSRVITAALRDASGQLHATS